MVSGSSQNMVPPGPPQKKSNKKKNLRCPSACARQKKNTQRQRAAFTVRNRLAAMNQLLIHFHTYTSNNSTKCERQSAVTSLFVHDCFNMNRCSKVCLALCQQASRNAKSIDGYLLLRATHSPRGQSSTQPLVVSGGSIISLIVSGERAQTTGICRR